MNSRNLIKRVAHNNPSLNGNETITMGDVYFYQTNKKLSETEEITVPLSLISNKHYNTLVDVAIDGYAVIDSKWLREGDSESGTVTIGLRIPDFEVVIPNGMLLDKVMNDEGINRDNEMPF